MTARKKIVPLMLRLPADMHKRLVHAARTGPRSSLNEEVLWCIETALTLSSEDVQRVNLVKAARAAEEFVSATGGAGSTPIWRK